MNVKALNEMHRIINQMFPTEELNIMLKEFLQEKILEKSIWSELTICTHFMFGGKSKKIYQMAALLELIILSLDILDDIQDNDNFEKPWMKCLPGNAMNAVIGFLIGALADLSITEENQKNNTTEIISLISQSIVKAINGQHKDLNTMIQTEEGYLSMVEEKSVSLVNLACQLGLITLECYDQKIKEQMEEIARNIGIVAQLKNDACDIMRLDFKNDVLKRKRTLPIIFLLSQSKEKFSIMLEYFNGEVSQSQFLKYKNNFFRFIDESGVIEYVETIQLLYLKKAKQLFELIPTVSPWNQRFREMVLTLD